MRGAAAGARALAGGPAAVAAAEALTLATEVSADEVAAVVSRWTGIPVDKLTSVEAAQLMSLEGARGRARTRADARLRARLREAACVGRVRVCGDARVWCGCVPVSLVAGEPGVRACLCLRLCVCLSCLCLSVCVCL
jgi:hypothetical protein